MMSGAIIVPPAIAPPCCRPETIVWPHGRRSSGMITPVVFGFQRGKYPSRISGSVAVDIFPLYSSNAPNLINEQGYEEQAMSAGCEHLYTHDRDKGGNRSTPPALPPKPPRSPSAYRLPDGGRA
jgi:hypothetical protein